MISNFHFDIIHFLFRVSMPSIDYFLMSSNHHPLKSWEKQWGLSLKIPIFHTAAVSLMALSSKWSTNLKLDPRITGAAKVLGKEQIELLHEFKKKTHFWKVDKAIETYKNRLKFQVVRKPLENTFIWRQSGIFIFLRLKMA